LAKVPLSSVGGVDSPAGARVLADGADEERGR
jgi:hypothetical protein